MSDEYPAPWRVRVSILRAQFPVRIIGNNIAASSALGYHFHELKAVAVVSHDAQGGAVTNGLLVGSNADSFFAFESQRVGIGIFKPSCLREVKVYEV